MRALICLLAVCALTALVGCSSAAAASSCPSETYLSYGHLAYQALAIPASVQLQPGDGVGLGTIDEPTSSSGCRRSQSSVRVFAAGPVAPQIAVFVDGRPHTLFVIGHRCDGFEGASYWSCLLRPLEFRGRPYTATSYPASPAPRGTLPLGRRIGRARYQGRRVTVRRIQGVTPSLAVAVDGQPSTAFLSPRTCPYSGFSNTPEYDNLLRCLRSPVWFTFNPLGSQTGGSVVATSDRAVPATVAGASISLVELPVVADLVPADHGRLVPVARVAGRVRIRIPHVPAGIYEAVVSCPRCSQAGAVDGLYPAGSILVTAKTKTSVGIRIVSYVLAAAFIVAVIFAVRTWRRRRGLRASGGRGRGRRG